MAALKERRKTPRSPSHVPCDIYDSKGKAIVGEGKCVDFSISGLRLASRKPMKAKTSIRLQVVPVKRPVLDISGRVVWARKSSPGFVYGISFSSKLPSPQL